MGAVDWMARCELCGEWRFDEREVLAYQRRAGTIHSVRLDGRNPWAGLFVICINCGDAMLVSGLATTVGIRLGDPALGKRAFADAASEEGG